MFILRVHSVDVDHPLAFEEATFSTVSTTTTQSNPIHNPKYSERRGVVHLYRNASQSSLPNPSSRSTSLFIVAVPNYLSADDFIRFCESHIDNVHELLFIRNDGMEDRYSVLIKLNDQLTADGFYGNFNGKRFSPAEVCRLCQQQDEIPSCSVCGTSENLWVCLICGFVGCGRYKEQHAIRHWQDTQHCYSLDLRTQQIWDYVGDNYVHRLNQSKADGKLVDMNTRCMSLEGDYGTCGCSEDSGISGALFSSKVETIVDEYNRLLANQLEAQRQNYESLIADLRSKRESSINEVVDKAVTSTMQDIQTKLEKCEQEKDAVAEINRSLIKNQEIWRKKVKEVEERETAALRSRDERIIDLEEQIRDLTVYIEAQKTLNNMTDTSDIQGGTLLPVPSKGSSPANNKRHTKPGRRRT
ncbi:hypothetical protein MANES_14G114800v8 [Manihot esculenta]|uniref:UBP-type domain-containing protein n=1 Tax=Manihot esculenta TaxID=3983 RepID=A0A2C9UM10_MANES|nr:hypothetical protein MANES_14G114800v8 [Manihot esculenta]